MIKFKRTETKTKQKISALRIYGNDVGLLDDKFKSIEWQTFGMNDLLERK